MEIISIEKFINFQLQILQSCLWVIFISKKKKNQLLNGFEFAELCNNFFSVTQHAFMIN